MASTFHPKDYNCQLCCLMFNEVLLEYEREWVFCIYGLKFGVFFTMSSAHFGAHVSKLLIFTMNSAYFWHESKPKHIFLQKP